jgi:hypothetical protein
MRDFDWKVILGAAGLLAATAVIGGLITWAMVVVTGMSFEAAGAILSLGVGAYIYFVENPRYERRKRKILREKGYGFLLHDEDESRKKGR